MARILLIEDNDSVRETFELILQSAAHEVVSARTGIEGQAALDREVFDLVITDIVMPDRDGVEVISSLRKRKLSVPILAVSGGSRTSAIDYLEMARILGADATLAKPVMAQDLLDCVDRLVASRAG